MRILKRNTTMVAVTAMAVAGLLGGGPGGPQPAGTDVGNGILHPMPPLGDIDCCHLAGISAEDDWETPVV